MKNVRFLAFVLSAAMLFSASACSKEPVEHEEQPIENTVIIKPVEEPEEPESKTEIEHEEEPSEPEEPEIPKPEDESVLILVNPWNHIPEDYVPELETVQGKYNLDKGSGIQYASLFRIPYRSEIRPAIRQQSERIYRLRIFRSGRKNRSRKMGRTARNKRTPYRPCNGPCFRRLLELLFRS